MEIQKTSRTFLDIKSDLKKLIKSYYPNTYNDFSESSHGMMLISLLAGIGDNINYYIDSLFKESNILTAIDVENIYSLAQMYGYKPKVTNASYLYATISITVPKSGQAPDWLKAFNIKKMSIWSSNIGQNLKFINIEPILFNSNNTKIRRINTDDNKIKLEQTIKFMSATEVSTIVNTPSDPIRFWKINLPDNNIIKIHNIYDIDNAEYYYEVDSLAQSYVYYEEKVDNLYRIKTKPCYNKFKTIVNSDNTISIVFGSGIINAPGEYIVPNFELLSDNNAVSVLSDINSNLDVSNFMYTNSYGKIPYNTQLKINYLRGGGSQSNITVSKNTIDKYTVELDVDNPDATVKNSISILEHSSAIGGSDGDTIQDIKDKTINYFNTHDRIITTNDFILATLNMPEKYGKITKAYVDNDNLSNNDFNNTVNLYILSNNENNELVTVNNLVKENLKEYLSSKRILTTGINIVDAFIINLQIYFSVISYPDKNKNEILYNCIDTLKTYFNINKWNINEPIFINEIRDLLYTVPGVRNVNDIQIKNIWGEHNGKTYSNIQYIISSAIKDNIIYPPMDPSIFFVQYPDIDIRGNIK